MALTAGEQALFDRAMSRNQDMVTSQFVPPESLARVNAAIAEARGASQAEVQARVDQGAAEAARRMAAAAEAARINAAEDAAAREAAKQAAQDQLINAGITSLTPAEEDLVLFAIRTGQTGEEDKLGDVPGVSPTLAQNVNQALDVVTGRATIDTTDTTTTDTTTTDTTTTDTTTTDTTDTTDTTTTDTGDLAARRQSIIGIYQGLLGRSPASGPLEYWVNSGIPLGEMRQAMINAVIAEGSGIDYDYLVSQGIITPDTGTDPGFTEGGFQYTPFDYTNMPAPPPGAVPSIFSVGGVFGPGQGMPQVPYVPGVDTGLGAGPAPSELTMAPGSYGDTGTVGTGPRTLFSPGITTYAYPQAFGNIDIFDRPGAQTGGTQYKPAGGNLMSGAAGAGSMASGLMGTGAMGSNTAGQQNQTGGLAQSSTNTTTQQNMAGGIDINNLSPAQRALLGNIFGNL